MPNIKNNYMGHFFSVGREIGRGHEKVVYEKKGEEITIVTTYLTNQIKRYWRD